MKLYLIHLAITYIAIGLVVNNYILIREYKDVVTNVKTSKSKFKVIARAVGVYLILPIVWGYFMAKVFVKDIG